MKGLEPPCLAAPDPKSGMSTNFITSAKIKKNLFFLYPAIPEGPRKYVIFLLKKDCKGIVFCELTKSFMRQLYRPFCLDFKKN